jgi:hypothetical protein
MYSRMIQYLQKKMLSKKSEVRLALVFRKHNNVIEEKLIKRVQKMSDTSMSQPLSMY